LETFRPKKGDEMEAGGAARLCNDMILQRER
jgi:hypothetical protein